MFWREPPLEPDYFDDDTVAIADSLAQLERYDGVKPLIETLIHNFYVTGDKDEIENALDELADVFEVNKAQMKTTR